MSGSGGGGSSDCACFNLQRAARLVAQAYDRRLRPTGLTNTQLSVLAVAARGPVSIGDLARSLGAERTTVTRNLQLMERRGLVRLAAGCDGRTKAVEVTPKGRRQYAAAETVWREAQSRIVAALGADWRPLVRGLRRVAEVSEAL
jgi:DNA-binding MarR family transcriptional regulator